MVNWRLMILAVMASLLTTAHQAASLDLPQQEFESAVSELESFFPQVEGYVVSVLEDIVYTDIPDSKGLLVGSEMTVIRKGEDIIHPITRQVLGKYEITLGFIRISQVRAEYATGNLLERSSSEEIKPGDIVRITSSRLRVAVADPFTENWSKEDILNWKNNLVYSLEKSTRFYPIELREPLPDNFKDQNEKINELAKEEEADALLVMEVIGPPENSYLNLHLFSGHTGLRISTARIALFEETDRTVKSAIGESLTGARAGSMEVVDAANLSRGVFELDYKIVSLCHGDLTGNKKGELAVTDGKSIYIYSRETSGWTLLWEDRGRPMYRILSIDCGDIDGNGLEEVFITRIAAGILKSIVLEYNGGVFVKKNRDKNLLYRVIKTENDHKRLFAQKFDSDNPSIHPVIEYRFAEGQYVPTKEGKIDRPSVYGFCLADIDGDDEMEVVGLGSSNNLEIYNLSGRRVWKSEERFGGSTVFVNTETMNQRLPDDGAGGYLVKVRILAFDLDGDKTDELVLFRNIPKFGNTFKNIRIYEHSRLGLYRWDGSNLVEISTPEKIYGYVADYAIAGDGDNTKELIVGVNAKPSMIRPEKGEIIIRPLVPVSREF